MRRILCLLPLLIAVTACVDMAPRGAVKTGPVTVLAGAGNRNPGCSVLVATNAAESERYAADELALHLGRMLGAKIPVAAEREAGVRGWAIRLACDPALGSDSYRIRLMSAERELLIAGGRPRGVLMGVYGLLADQLGCRWYTPDIDYVPALGKLALPSDLDVQTTPRLEYRATDWGEAGNPDWAARNRLNALSGLQAKHGGGIVFSPFVHTFDSILNPAARFDSHPEYFSAVNGKRIKDGAQLCLSNPDVLRAAISKAKEWAGAGGGNNILSVSQNDYLNPCECQECKAIDDEEGAHSGSLIRFVNRVAEAVEREYPRATVETLAYLHTRKPPARAKPRHNVIVRLCSIECCFSHPLDECPEQSNTSFMDDIRGWHRLTDRLYIWDYTTDFCQFLMPFPNLDVLDLNMRTFVNHGVKGMFAEGNPYIDGELGELRSWLLAQLMWNPDLDGRQLQHEFVSRVYGPCANVVQEYLDIQRNAIVAGGDHVRVFDAPERMQYLNDDVLRRCDAKMEEAEPIAKKSGDPALLKRITRLRMCIWFTQFCVRREKPSVVRNTARRLVAAGREFGLTRVSLYHDWPSLEKSMERTYVNYPFEVESVKPSAMAWTAPSHAPFLASILFRDGANAFGMWDTGFDDRQGTMEAWVWCGPASTNLCQGRGALFDIRSPQSRTGHRVWIDADVQTGVFTPHYETWAGGVTNRIVGEPMKPNVWHHISATWEAARQGGEMNLYADARPTGKAAYTPTECGGEIVFYIGMDFSIGKGVASSFGPIDEVRLSTVVRRPALQTAAYETDANTRLLLHFDEPAAENIADSSGIAR